MKNLILVLIVFLSLSMEKVSCQEQATTDNKKIFKNGLGVAAGFTMGYGLSYRYQPKRFGAQITFSPYKDKETTQISSGLTFVLKLAETNDKYVNFFAYQSNSYFHGEYSDTYNSSDSNINIHISSYIVNSKKDFFNNGIGIGVEFFAFNGFTFDMMGGYAFYKNFSEYRLTGETSLLFKF